MYAAFEIHFSVLYGLNLPLYYLFQVVRDKRTGKTKGYGFVSFSNPTDLAAAIKEMNGLYLQYVLRIQLLPLICMFSLIPLLLLDELLSGKYVGNRPIKLRKSNWKERTDVEALERQKVPVCFLL